MAARFGVLEGGYQPQVCTGYISDRTPGNALRPECTREPEIGGVDQLSSELTSTAGEYRLVRK
jgi:hypothetical protein